AGGSIPVECVRSSNPPNRSYDHNGPATVIAERRPDAHEDFGRSAVSVPARRRIDGSDVRHRSRVRGWAHAGLGRWNIAVSRRRIHALAQFEMSLTFEGRKVDAGDAADWNVIEREVSHHFDLRRPIVTFDGAQVGAAAVDRHAEFGASSRVGEFDANMTACDGFLQRLPRFFPQPRFDRMIALAEKLYQLAHSTPPRRFSNGANARYCSRQLALFGLRGQPTLSKPLGC